MAELVCSSSFTGGRGGAGGGEEGGGDRGDGYQLASESGRGAQGGVPFMAGSGQGGASVDSLRRRSGGGLIEEQRSGPAGRTAGPPGVTCGSAVVER
jgi:hypothetical protein